MTQLCLSEESGETPVTKLELTANESVKNDFIMLSILAAMVEIPCVRDFEDMRKRAQTVPIAELNQWITKELKNNEKLPMSNMKLFDRDKQAGIGPARKIFNFQPMKSKLNLLLGGASDLNILSKKRPQSLRK